MAGAGFRFTSAGYKKYKPFIEVINDSMIRSVVKNLDDPSYRFIFVINASQISKEDFNLHVEDLDFNFEILEVDKITEGPACSALVAKGLINNLDPLIIVNCDQIIGDFNAVYLEEFSRSTEADGFIGCFLSSSKKNSYIKTDPNGEVVEVKEKIVISNIATNGLHYWKFGKYFVESAEEMIRGNDRYNGEFYIAPTYNYLINKGKKILPYFFNLHFPIGIPEDLEKYKNTYK
jgi:dTDP-glucose pyrophosphorylase